MKTRTKRYAGIGNRDLTGAMDGCHGLPIQKVMHHLAAELEKLGYTLYSGGAKGCDAAFESGVSAPAHKRIFTADDATDETRAMARTHKLPEEILLGRKLDLYAREVFQIFGADQKSPWILCCATLATAAKVTRLVPQKPAAQGSPSNLQAVRESP